MPIWFDLPMTRKKKANSVNPGRGRDSDIQIVDSSAETKAMIAVFGEIDDEAHDAARRSWPDLPSRDYDFDKAILERGINALKGVRLLVEHGHWELAQGVLRQLFELVINIEYLHYQPDRREAMQRYGHFGLLEKLQARRDEMKYDEQAGHPVDLDRLAALEEYLAGPEFDEFRNKKGGFITSWASRKTKELCELSKMGLRMRQYELLYSAWSEHAHATPGALVDSILRTSSPGWVEEVVADDETNIQECVRMAISLFVELRMYLPSIDPLHFDLTSDWFGRVLPAPLRTR
jgi:hypothetical protein